MKDNCQILQCIAKYTYPIIISIIDYARRKKGRDMGLFREEVKWFTTLRVTVF